MGGSRYVHGTEPDEQARLSALNDWINARCLAAMRLTPGLRVLDVGAGLGQLTRDMARAIGVGKPGGGHVIGIERSAEQLAEAMRQARAHDEDRLIELRHGDATALPLQPDEWGSFNIVHTRFVLEHVRDPLAVVRQMVAAARPDGRIILSDDHHEVMTLWPQPAGFDDLWRAYCRAYEKIGNDPFVGRRLVSLLHDAGARPAKNDWLFFGSCSGDARFPQAVENLVGVIETARGEMVPDLIDRGAFEAALTSLREWKSRPDAAIWYAIAWAEGVRPA